MWWKCEMYKFHENVKWKGQMKVFDVNVWYENIWYEKVWWRCQSMFDVSLCGKCKMKMCYERMCAEMCNENVQ